MTGQELYAHYRDCFYTENKGDLFSIPKAWPLLPETEKRAWDRLAKCVEEGRGVTMEWRA